MNNRRLHQQHQRRSFDVELEAKAPNAMIEKKNKSRVQRCELRWLDGPPATVESLRTRPSNVTVI
jgi:hypothetical protein